MPGRGQLDPLLFRPRHVVRPKQPLDPDRELPCVAQVGREDFAFESTLSGLGHVGRLKRWRKTGYNIEMIYLTLPSAQIALRRIAARVRQGGHDVPKPDVLRRFQRSWTNFQSLYRPLADWWCVYDNSGENPKWIEEGP